MHAFKFSPSLSNSVYHLFILFTFPFVFHTQTSITLEGKTQNKEGHPLSNVKITAEGSNSFILSDNKGKFKLEISASNNKICFETIGYEKKCIAIGSDSAHINLVVVLTQKNYELDQVDIQSELTHLAYHNQQAYTIDFDFFNNDILLLIEENKKFKLRLIDENENNLGELNLRSEPKGLFRDCLDKLHVICTDQVFQIAVAGSDLYFSDSAEVNLFQKILTPCAAATDSVFIFHKFSSTQQTLQYILVNKSNSQSKLLRSISNKEAENYSLQFAQYTGFNTAISAPVTGDLDYLALEFARKTEGDQHFIENILLQPIYSPLLKLNDTLYLFDHLADTAYVFNRSGSLFKKLSIEYENGLTGKQFLITDNFKKHIYLISKKESFYRLFQFNSVKEEFSFLLDLKDYPYAEKLKIKGNFVYFIFREREGGNFNYLYKKKIRI